VTNRSHWPFQSGYFASSAACATPTVTISAAASPNAPVEPRCNMIMLPALADHSADRHGRHVDAAVNRIHRSVSSCEAEWRNALCLLRPTSVPMPLLPHARPIWPLLPIMYESVHMAGSVLRRPTGTVGREAYLSGSGRRGATKSTCPGRDGARQPQQRSGGREAQHPGGRDGGVRRQRLQRRAGRRDRRADADQQADDLLLFQQQEGTLSCGDRECLPQHPGGRGRPRPRFARPGKPP